MTNDRPGGDTPDDPADRSGAPDRPSNTGSEWSGGILGSIRRLLETLQGLDEHGESTTGGSRTSPTGRTQVDYSVTVGPIRSEDSTGDRPTEATATADFPTDIRETDEGLVVHVDVPEADGKTIAAGVDGRTLVLGADDTVLSRIDLPRPGLTVVAGVYRNGVLELHLSPTDTDQ